MPGIGAKEAMSGANWLICPAQKEDKSSDELDVVRLSGNL